jgi:hypothetical protein
MAYESSPTQALAANPMFGRPIWSYVQVSRGPASGPQPKLARGIPQTGANSGFPGTNAQLPAYVADYEYFPTVFTYDPVHNPVRVQPIPNSLSTPGKDDGLRALNPTYRAHEFRMGNRFNHQMRSAYNWQVMEFPVNFRNLLSFQQVRKYIVNSFTVQARPLPQSNYFLGYKIDQTVAQQIGGSGNQ